jgi:hypothetical protein
VPASVVYFHKILIASNLLPIFRLNADDVSFVIRLNPVIPSGCQVLSVGLS